MSEKEFLLKMADILDLEEEVTLDTGFRESGEWSSLKGFAVLVYFENELNRELPIDDFMAMKSIRDLYDYAVR